MRRIREIAIEEWLADAINLEKIAIIQTKIKAEIVKSDLQYIKNAYFKPLKTYHRCKYFKAMQKNYSSKQMKFNETNEIQI